MNDQDQFIPHVVVNDGLAAMKFYLEVFGGTEGDTMMAQDGKRLMHGEVIVGGHTLFVSDEFPDEAGGTLRLPEKLGGTCVRITFTVNDANSVMDRAVERGSRVLMPVQDMFWGARYGKFIDPYGHEWGINQQQKEMTPEETEAEAEKFFAKP